MTVAVVCCTLGGYDAPEGLPEQTVPYQSTYISDEHAMSWSGHRDAHPRLLAKVPKCRPDLYTNTDVNIWIDGSFRVKSPRFVEWCVEQLGAADLAMFRHPHRNGIIAEAEVSKQMTKYQGHPVQDQATSYIARGFQGTPGLWATGLIVSRPTKRIRQLGDAWLREQLRWTWQDQISLPPLLEELDIEPVALDGPLVGNHLFDIRAHRRED